MDLASNWPPAVDPATISGGGVDLVTNSHSGGGSSKDIEGGGGVDLVTNSDGGMDPTPTSGTSHQRLWAHGSSHKRVDAVTRADGGRASGVSSHEGANLVTSKLQVQGFKGDAREDPATSERIQSLESAVVNPPFSLDLRIQD